MEDLKITDLKYATRIAEKITLEKTETPDEKKQRLREERRKEISNERLVYMAMPTKQLIETIQQGQQKETPDPSRAQAYKRVEQLVNSKVNRLA